MIMMEIKVVMVIVNLSHDNVISSINDTNTSSGIAITIDIHFIVTIIIDIIILIIMKVLDSVHIFLTYRKDKSC